MGFMTCVVTIVMMEYYPIGLAVSVLQKNNEIKYEIISKFHKRQRDTGQKSINVKPFFAQQISNHRK